MFLMKLYPGWAMSLSLRILFAIMLRVGCVFHSCILREPAVAMKAVHNEHEGKTQRTRRNTLNMTPAR
jgi:hypothetical protein